MDSFMRSIFNTSSQDIYHAIIMHHMSLYSSTIDYEYFLTSSFDTMHRDVMYLDKKNLKTVSYRQRYSPVCASNEIRPVV